MCYARDQDIMTGRGHYFLKKIAAGSNFSMGVTVFREGLFTSRGGVIIL